MTSRRPVLLTPAFLLLGASSLAYFVAIGMTLPVVPRFVEETLGGSKFEVGLVAGSFSLSAIFLRPLAGRLGDLRGRKFIIVAGAVTVALSQGAYYFAETIPFLIFLRLLNGVGEAFFFTGGATAVADMAPPERRGEALSLFSVALYAGIASGPLLGEFWLERFGYEIVWIGSAALALLAAVVALPVRETRPDEESDTAGSILHRGGLVTGVVLTASVWAFAGYSAFVPLYALQVGLSGSRMLFALYSSIVLLVRLVGARIPDALGAKRTAMISMVTTVASMVVMATVPTREGLFSGTALLGIGQSLAFPALMSLTIGAVPFRERASVIATFTAFIDVGFGIGPLALGLIAESAGYRGAFASSAVIAAAGLGVLLTRPSGPKPPDRIEKSNEETSVG